MLSCPSSQSVSPSLMYQSTVEVSETITHITVRNCRDQEHRIKRTSFHFLNHITVPTGQCHVPHPEHGNSTVGWNNFSIYQLNTTSQNYTWINIWVMEGKNRDPPSSASCAWLPPLTLAVMRTCLWSTSVHASHSRHSRHSFLHLSAILTSVWKHANKLTRNGWRVVLATSKMRFSDSSDSTSSRAMMSPFFSALMAKYSPVLRYCVRITCTITLHMILLRQICVKCDNWVTDASALQVRFTGYMIQWFCIRPSLAFSLIYGWNQSCTEASTKLLKDSNLLGRESPVMVTGPPRPKHKSSVSSKEKVQMYTTKVK